MMIKEQKIKDHNNKVIVEYEKELRQQGVELYNPIDILHGKCKIKLEDFDQNKIRCWDIWEEAFYGNHQTLSEWIYNKDKMNSLLSNTQKQDLYVLIQGSRSSLCPVCNNTHTANDINFSADQKCMGVNIQAELSLFAGEPFIVVAPGQEYAINIVVNGEVKTKIHKPKQR